jgi:sugar (pentulose or hexulose) kinase
MVRNPLPVVGLDVGTSAVRALARGAGGRMAAARQPLPLPHLWRGLPVQDPVYLERAAREAVARVLAGLAEEEGRAPSRDRAGPPEKDAALRQDDGAPPPAPGAPLARVALTTQRDTLLLVQGAEASGAAAPGLFLDPLTPLLSWQERRHLEEPALRARLLGGGTPPGARPMALEAWLAARLAGDPGVRPGPPPPPLDGPFHVLLAGGDKNCEYLALGVGLEAPGMAGLSLGSAISLGVAVPAPGPRALPPGVVASPAPGGAPVVHLETGILSGMQGRAAAAALAGVAPRPGALPPPGAPGLPDPDPLEVVPWFGGALDDLDARPCVRGLRPGEAPATLDPARVARGWAWGVARELARLLPALEAAAGERITRVQVGGGGAGDPAWTDLLHQALGLPVERVPDPWLGARGALLAVWEEPGFPGEEGVPPPYPAAETSPRGGG